jgi:hypothetical protein
MPVAPGIFQKLYESVGALAKRYKLDKAWQFVQGEHPWVPPAFLAAGAAPVIGLILEQRNKAREEEEKALKRGGLFPYRAGYPYPPYAGERAVLDARRAVKEALDKSAVSTGRPQHPPGDQPLVKDPDPARGLDKLRELLHEAKARAQSKGTPAMGYLQNAEPPKATTLMGRSE